MRVKSIVIDGFKSYAHRKELADLSSHFNAITGLNGSGKSNIFDAICFVMGITNLKRVRAEDPRELIFRAGTTGVHAARVTLEFINDDPATAPPGYSCEDYPVITIGRQIKLGGKQQFFFNNTVSMQSKVKRFFESISLNVDNPHFMVLQGTVHKLIGMRSQDILALIEEAVGTKAFDHRRRTAETLIRNKEKKIEEIDANIETQIGPMLEAMKADQEEYRRFMTISEGLEGRRKFRIAFEYAERGKQLEERERICESRRSDVSMAKAQLSAIPEQEDELTRRLMKLQDSLGAPSEAAIALHEEEGELKKSLGRVHAQLDGCAKALKQVEGQLKSLHKEKERQVKSQKAFEERRGQHEALLASIKEEKERVTKLKQALRLVQSGVRAGTSGVSLEEERSQLEMRLIQLEAAARRGTETAADLQEQLTRLRQSSKKEAGARAELEREVSAAASSLAAMEKQYTPLSEKERRRDAVDERVRDAKQEYQRAYEAFQRESGSRSFDLDYNRRACQADIESQVLGRVGELVYPADAKYSTALMVGAQSQLLRVVVQTDAVAEEIIRAGLRQRTSFLALNKLPPPRVIERSKVEEAEKVAKRMGGFVYVAKDLAAIKNSNYSSNSSHDADTFSSASLRTLADHVYGNFFVCTNLALAQELAYRPEIKVKAVTVDGEIAEPNGLMTGGSTAQLRDVFAELRSHEERRAPLTRLQAKVQSLEQEYHTLRQELLAKQDVLYAYKDAEERLEIAKQRLQLATGGGAGGAAGGGGGGLGGIAEVEVALEKLAGEMAENKGEAAKLRARRAELESEASVDVESSCKQLQKELATAEAHVAKLSKEEAAGAAEFETLEADMEQQAADLASKTREAEEELAQQQRSKVQLMSELENATQLVESVKERIRKTEEQRQRLEREIEETQEDLTRLTEKKATLDNVVKNAEVDLREDNKVMEELRRFLRDEERRHVWIAAEKVTFGDASGPYYFSDSARTAAALQGLREAEAQAAVMSQKMNKKSTILYEDRKKEYDELVKQRSALGEDKEAIQACILGIEAKKWHALDRMVSVVSNIFGKLFSTCLPGTAAQLVEERNENGHLSGLGVRVLFNGKPKESLTELSGGQRSLLALCLLLAILRVRPAPIYILDEVDAALDPSHTQNIGRMLQLYFPNSQFLLVSLKDGMFNNANVLYHIRNTQGYSEVSRVENQIPGGRHQQQQPRGSNGDGVNSVLAGSVGLATVSG